MRCLCLATYPPSPPLTLYVVCCVVHMLLQNCVYARGERVHMHMHALSVLVAMRVLRAVLCLALLLCVCLRTPTSHG